MKHSIRNQFALIFIGLLAGTILLCWFINNRFLEKYYISSKAEKIDSAYSLISQAVGADEEVDLNALKELNYSSFEDNILVTVTDPSGFVEIYTSPNGGAEFTPTVRRFIRGGYAGVEADTIAYFYNDRTQYIREEYLGRFGVMKNGNTYLICTPLESIRDSVMLANRFLAYIGAVMVVVGGVLIWLVTKKVTDPILQLTAISKRMASLDFDAKYCGKSHNEIALLGENINKLSDSLERTISELKTANNELLRDIEKKEAVDEMRKEFLSNVSHELKTPIALIQGYAEGLLEGISDDPESMRFYCEVIIDESSRMNHMVKKLLTLNQLEFGKDAVSMDRFDIVTLLRNYIQSAGLMAKQNEIEVRMEKYAPIYVWGDEFKVEEVVMNYFTNAVNHCEAVRADQGGIPGQKPVKKMIDIRVELRDNKVRVGIFNTGMPIPEESLSHLWEKFYKVDKARTREYGGSGIGLSIVKAIMESMNQNYGVQNFTNGVQFWFELEAVMETETAEQS